MGLSNIYAIAARARAAVAGITITYRRGDLTVEIRATLGQTRFEQQIPDGNPIVRQTRDYLFPATSLVLDEEQVLPERGDLIEETVGDSTLVYEILPVEDGETFFRYSDPERQEIRVHTQKIR